MINYNWNYLRRRGWRLKPGHVEGCGRQWLVTVRRGWRLKTEWVALVENDPFVTEILSLKFSVTNLSLFCHRKISKLRKHKNFVDKRLKFGDKKGLSPNLSRSVTKGEFSTGVEGGRQCNQWELRGGNRQWWSWQS